MVLITVVVGKATVVAPKEAPQVIALAVPSSVNLNSILSPSTGVPERFVVIEVIAAFKPVKFIISTLSVFVVGVAPGAFVVIKRLVTLLFVSVFVLDIEGIATPLNVGAFVTSKSVNHPLVTLEPVVAIEPVIVKLCVPKATVPLNVCVPVNVFEASVRAIVADVEGNVITVPSVPEKVSVFVTARVFAFVSVSVPVVVDIVNPFTLVGVIAPRVKVIAGVVVAVATLPDTPFAVVTDTDVTVPEPPPVAERVVPSNDNPLPIVTALIAVPLPFRIPVMLVEIVIAGVVVAVATVPANPFAEVTETLVTLPVPTPVVLANILLVAGSTRTILISWFASSVIAPKTTTLFSSRFNISSAIYFNQIGKAIFR